MYVDDPGPLITSLSRPPGGIVSVMALNAKTLAVRPALERRWGGALAAFETSGEQGVLGVETRADTVEELSEPTPGMRMALRRLDGPLGQRGGLGHGGRRAASRPPGPLSPAQPGLSPGGSPSSQGLTCVEAQRCTVPHQGMSVVISPVVVSMTPTAETAATTGSKASRSSTALARSSLLNPWARVQ